MFIHYVILYIMGGLSLIAVSAAAITHKKARADQREAEKEDEEEDEEATNLR